MSAAVLSSLPDASQRMHFTLGDLFRGLTICSVGTFVAVQYDPLLAIRAVGMGLAVGIAFVAWRRRSNWRWIGAAAMIGVGFLPTVVVGGVPFSHRDLVCYECGCQRDMHEVWGYKTQDEIQETEASRWAAPLLPDDHVHQWMTTSHHGRSDWFGSAPIACGGYPEGAFIAWHFARLGDQKTAEALFQEYCEIRRGRSTKPLQQFNNEASAAFEAAWKARQP